MGLIHIYCGSGKGKTTAAVGLSVRAAGAGKKIHIVQFLKGNNSSELEILLRIPGISVGKPRVNYGFTSKMSEDDKEKLTLCHNRILSEAYEKMLGGEIDMLVLDEFFAAYNKNLLDKVLAEKTVFEKTRECELVLTGREPPEKFILAADYVSEISAVKHPYEKGIKARKGIEY